MYILFPGRIAAFRSVFVDEGDNAWKQLLMAEDWRGLAHFRTESRRRVFKKSPPERKANELYILEEVVSEIKLISNLPFSKRIEVCKLLLYEAHERNSVVYREGDIGDKFYIIFTGSVKVTNHSHDGGKEKILGVLYPGNYFGDAVLIHGHVERSETITTLSKCEFLTLSKPDYDKILETNLSPEVLRNFGVLKEISVLRNVPIPSLYRLASIVTSRTFAKNRAITLQGDEAREMYFIKSGECRVVMEVIGERKPPERSLPRAASSLSQYRATKHDKCKQEVKDREKNWWHPQRFSSPIPMRRCQSVPPILPSKNIVDSRKGERISDTHSRSAASSPTCENVNRPSTAPVHRQFLKRNTHTPSLGKFNRPNSVPLLGSSISKPRRRTANGVSGVDKDLKSTTSCSSDTGQLLKSKMFKAQRASGHFDTKDSSSRQEVRSSPSRRAKRKKYDYSLASFLKEVDERIRDDLIQDMDFSDQEPFKWGMGTHDTGMLRGDVGDAIVYQSKFEKWARKVIAREKRIAACEAISEAGAPTYRKGFLIEKGINAEAFNDASTVTPGVGMRILDVGSLHAGEFFGEIALLQKSIRAASILTVTDVEVLVLSKWDFYRRLDRDITDCLSANDYKRPDFIQNEYNRTRRWALFKKKVVDEILVSKCQVFPNRAFQEQKALQRQRVALAI